MEFKVLPYCGLITGASNGIGKAMAFECASHGMNVALIALDNVDLSRTAQEISEQYPEITVDYFGIDLTETGAPEKVYHWTRALDHPVNVLINNAGTGNSGLFEERDLEEYINIINLNNRSLIELTYHFIKDLRKNGKGHILNVSSMEATLPLPYKAVYTGSKNFIYAFTLALREELRGSGVSATVLCPGSVVTNQQGLERIQAHGNKGKFINKLMITYPDVVARKAIKGMLKGRQVIIPNVTPWAIVKFMKLMPTTLKMRILERIFRVYR